MLRKVLHAEDRYRGGVLEMLSDTRPEECFVVNTTEESDSTGLLARLLIVVALLAFMLTTSGCALLDGVMSRLDGETQPAYPTSQAGAYTHRAIGISVLLADGWYASENDIFPNSDVNFHSKVDSDPYVWIASFYGEDVDMALYLRNKQTLLTTYTGGLMAETYDIVLEEFVEINGHSWYHVLFTMSNKWEDLSVDFYLADFPTHRGVNRGVIMYGIISPITYEGQTVFPGHAEAFETLESLRFIK